MKITVFGDFEKTGEAYFGNFAHGPYEKPKSEGKAIAITAEIKSQNELTEEQTDAIRDMMHDYFFIDKEWGSVLPYKEVAKNLESKVKNFDASLQKTLSMNGFISRIDEEMFVDRPTKPKNGLLVLEIEREVVSSKVIYDANDKKKEI